jgi:hypothetical protein
MSRPVCNTGQVLAHQRGRRDQEEENDQGEASGGRNHARIEWPCRSGQPLGLGGGTSCYLPRLYSLDEIRQRLLDHVRVLENHEVVAAVHHQLTLRYETVVFACCGGRHQWILDSVEDQHRAGIVRQNVAERPLSALVEVPGVLDTQHPAIQHAEVGHQLPESP